MISSALELSIYSVTNRSGILLILLSISQFSVSMIDDFLNFLLRTWSCIFVFHSFQEYKVSDYSNYVQDRVSL